jgi:mannosyltransferase
VLVVHPHFHRRRTGVTQHVESVVRHAEVETRAIGTALDGVPRIALREVIRRARGEPVIWHAHRNLEAIVGLMLRAWTRSVRVVFTRHSLRRASWLTRWLARRANRVVALTKFVGAGVGTPFEIVGHGIDLARFAPAEDRARAFAELGLGGERGIGIVGRIRPDKGHEDYVRAVTALLEKHEDWRSIWVGRVKPHERAWAAKQEALLGPRHRTFPEERDIARWYRGLTLVVQPSHSESYSLVLLEAMASGCCVVAAEMPHYRDFIEHGRTGFLYPPGDVGALRALLVPLLENPGRAEVVGRAAAESARARFGIQREVAQLEQIYRSM